MCAEFGTMLKNTGATNLSEPLCQSYSESSERRPFSALPTQPPRRAVIAALRPRVETPSLYYR